MAFKHYPLGSTITGSVHSVCVSLPAIADIRAYEEKDPQILRKMKCGYPRFIIHPFIERLRRATADSEGGVEPWFCASERSASALLRYAAAGRGTIREMEDCYAVMLPAEPAIGDRARQFLQHTGCGISSRQAEDALVRRKLRRRRYPEKTQSRTPGRHVRQVMHQSYGTADPDDILLCRGGMNAFYAGFQALRKIQSHRGRNLWIQFGWLYVDTIRILEKFGDTTATPKPFYNIFDMDALAAFLKKNGKQVAGIVTEVPNNPLVQTCDLGALHELAHRHGAALVIDPTIAGAGNVRVLPFADLHINSLTKYAGIEADTMLGTVAFNRESPFYPDLAELVPQYRDLPYRRDLERLACQISSYPEVLERINQSTPRVVESLEAHPAVDRVWWALSEPSAENFHNVANPGGGGGAVITFTLNKPLETFYDQAAFVKGPSFGARFTMMCPFMYLAHYDLVTTRAGRAFLESIDLPPELIRFSVGLEPVDAILAELDRALAPA